jgi:predicted HTH transcriptional regulator
MCELQGRIDEGEGEKLVFQTEILDAESLAATLVAFANSQGGSVFLGVKRSGKIKGVNPSAEESIVKNLVLKYTKPHVPYRIMVCKIKHYFVVEVRVEQSGVKHQAKGNQGEWKSFIRIDSHTCRTNKIIDLAGKLSDSLSESTKYNEVCKREILLKLKGDSLTLSKLYTESNFTLKEIDYNLSCLVYLGTVCLSVFNGKIHYSLA